MPWLVNAGFVFALIFIIDRIWKSITIWRFFYRASAIDGDALFPDLSLIQPVTASPNNLLEVLKSRATVCYPGKVEQVIIFDDVDTASQALCRQVMQIYPGWQPKLVLAKSPNGTAIKTVKLLAGLENATCEVLCFIDDDILLRENTLPSLVGPLQQPGIGAVFGLACYTNWGSVWGGLMSVFVNANALLTYVPISYLIDPYTITGHLYALKRSVFEAIGGMDGMSERLDDDHELARRVMRAGLRNKQTRAIYNVDNELPNIRSFMIQMKRWFIFPRELMLPGIPAYQQVLTLVSSLPNLIPGVLFFLAFWQHTVFYLLMISLLVFCLTYFWMERWILKKPTPYWSWLLLIPAALVLPFQVFWLLFSDNQIIWRGKRYLVRKGGRFEVID